MIVIFEFMRLFFDIERLFWDEVWEIMRKVFVYINYIIFLEVLEKWLVLMIIEFLL